MRRGYSKRDTGWLLGAAAVAATLAAVLPSYLAGTAAVPSAPALAPRPAPAQVMAPTTPSPATFGQIEKGGLQPHRLPPLKLSPPYEVADGLTILTETRRIRLAGLEGPAARPPASTKAIDCGPVGFRPGPPSTTTFGTRR